MDSAVVIGCIDEISEVAGLTSRIRIREASQKGARLDKNILPNQPVIRVQGSPEEICE